MSEWEWYSILDRGVEKRYSSFDIARADFNTIARMYPEGEATLIKTTLVDRTENHLQRLFCRDARTDRDHERHTWFVTIDDEPMKVLCRGYDNQ